LKQTYKKNNYSKSIQKLKSHVIIYSAQLSLIRFRVRPKVLKAAQALLIGDSLFKPWLPRKNNFNKEDRTVSIQLISIDPYLAVTKGSISQLLVSL